jgi:protoporphyrinogen oxidase
VNYKGNRIDIGGHRFFSKSDRVMDWWADMLPAQKMEAAGVRVAYQGQARDLLGSADGPDPDTTDRVMLVRNRKSRIFFLRRFFDYPIALSARTVRNLGAWRMAKIVSSYLKTCVRPIPNEQNLEQFFINRFGRELYLTFFKSYTEKVWGVPCSSISAEWGAQRIKGLSIRTTIAHAVKKLVTRDRSVRQKEVETSLIERFLYPKFGPGQMWETCAAKVVELGGTIVTNQRVTRLLTDGGRRLTGVVAVDTKTGQETRYEGDYVFSTMPVKHLVRGLGADVPANVREVAEGLIYRDFITVGILLDELRLKENSREGSRLLADNWIYIQEPDVKVGRLQIFNNWSPYMVANRDNVWVGMEYFVNEGDELWSRSDEEMAAFGVEELSRLGFIEPAKVKDTTVIKMPKTYPAYFGSYDRFNEVRSYLDEFENLFLVGRNGMHRYNNQDHSMLTAMTAVDNILAGRTDKSNIWNVNTEQEYHEEQKAPAEPVAAETPAPALGQGVAN